MKAFHKGKFYIIKEDKVKDKAIDEYLDKGRNSVHLCTHVFYDRVHAFFGTDHNIAYKIDWVNGPYDSYHEAYEVLNRKMVKEKVENFKTTKTKDGDGLGHHDGIQVTNFGFDKKSKTPLFWDNKTQQWRTLTIKLDDIKEIIKSSNDENDEKVKLLEQKFDEFVANGITPTINELIASSIENYVSNSENAEKLNKLSEDFVLINNDYSKLENRNKTLTQDIENIKDLFNVSIDLLKSELSDEMTKNRKSAFKVGNTLYAVLDNTLWVQATNGSWTTVAPSDKLVGDARMKAELAEIDRKADEDINKIYENFRKRWESPDKLKDRHKKEFSISKEKELSKTSKSSLKMVLSVFLTLIVTMAALSIITYMVS